MTDPIAPDGRDGPDQAAGDAALPLAGLRVVEFSHMVMGPSCGMVLGDLGADVIKVEPLDGDRTRRLLGAGAGFFPMFNRNKRSIAIDLQSPQGVQLAQRLALSADVVVENFKAGVVERLGLDHQSLSARNPRLIHVSLKGFLPGPYESRTALDEVVQMMGGLAYMTGRPGDPLRAGTSVNDIMGGMFGAIGVLSALVRRSLTGRGMAVRSALFENNVFLVGQHILQHAVTGQPVPPMPARTSPWAVYDVFNVAQGEQIFVAAVSDPQWITLCRALDWQDLREDARLATNNLRVQARTWLMPELRKRLADHDAGELAATLERHGLPFAPIRRPEQLLSDEHVVATGGLASITLPDGERAGQGAAAPLLPLTLDGQRPGVRQDPPTLGRHTREVLSSIGCEGGEIEELLKAGIVH